MSTELKIALIIICCILCIITWHSIPFLFNLIKDYIKQIYVNKSINLEIYNTDSIKNNIISTIIASIVFLISVFTIIFLLFSI